MARKQRDLLGLEREDAVRKQKLTLGALLVGIGLVVILIIVLIRGRGSSSKQPAQAVPEVPEETAVTETVTPEPTPTPEVTPSASLSGILPQDPEYTQKATILCTGDNLIHEAIYDDVESEDEEGYYDFRPIYSRVKPFIEAADLATVNMETPLATSIGDPSGYPHFNSPRGAGYALVDAGFDVINHANNHVMDMGTEGVLATLDYWANYDMPVVGAYRSSDDMYTMRVEEVNGISVAFLGIAEFTNYDIPSSSSIRVPLFSDDGLAEELIRRAKESADVVVVHAHWGEEDQDVITETMEVFSQRMVDWGADIIFGNHTHIVQKLELLTRESDGQLCPVIMSNGNFVSAQKERSHLLSGLEVVTVAKNPSTGAIQIQNLEYLPVVTHYEGDRENFVIYPLDQYTDELAASHGVASFEGEPMSREYLESLLERQIPREFRVTTETISLRAKADAMAEADAEAAAQETAAETGTPAEEEAADTADEETADTADEEAADTADEETADTADEETADTADEEAADTEL